MAFGFSVGQGDRHFQSLATELQQRLGQAFRFPPELQATQVQQQMAQTVILGCQPVAFRPTGESSIDSIGSDCRKNPGAGRG